MTETLHPSRRLTAFVDGRRILSGDDATLAARLPAMTSEAGPPALVIDDATGRPTDVKPAAEPAPRPGRGRPKLGVVPREVTLLPRHWDWLATQPGGASVALRKLVEEARRASRPADRQRQARDAAYHAMSALAGDFPGFEEASRALFADDRPLFAARIADWPADIVTYLTGLLDRYGED